MHGDFTPWNLRQRRDGTLILVDWEDAAWAPPGADEVYYAATAGVFGGRTTRGRTEAREASVFLRDRTSDRLKKASLAADRDQTASEALLAELERRAE